MIFIIKKFVMKRNVVTINEEKLTNAIKKAFVRNLKEGFDTQGFFDDLNNMVDNPGEYFKNDDDDSDFLQCSEEVSQFINELEQRYDDDLIIRAFEEELEGLRKTAEVNREFK